MKDEMVSFIDGAKVNMAGYIIDRETVFSKSGPAKRAIYKRGYELITEEF